MVYVTHDQVEAMTLGQRIAVFNGGRIEQCGAPLSLYDKPASRFVAGFIGSPAMNFLQARSVGVDSVNVGGQLLQVPPLAVPWPAELVLGVRPEHLSLCAPSSGISATVDFVEHLGDAQVAHLSLTSGESIVVRLSAEHPRPKVGDAVGVQLPPTARIHLFSADAAGQRLN
jgi:multiple sugar transport system ATP-binding protein